LPKPLRGPRRFQHGTDSASAERNRWMRCLPWLRSRYKAVIAAADRLPRLFPMLMTAGTIPPARIFVIGAGVAGLQAIATARRLGALWKPTTCAPPRASKFARSRTLSDVDLADSAKEAELCRGADGKALDRGRDLITRTAAHSDVIITTAQFRGVPRHCLSREAIRAMRPGSVVVDLAAPRWQLRAHTTGRRAKHRRRDPTRANSTCLGSTVHASQLYARNILNFLALIVKNGELTLDLKDEVLAGPASHIMATCESARGQMLEQSPRQANATTYSVITVRSPRCFGALRILLS